MFKVLLICAFIGMAAAVESDAKAEVLSQKQDVRADGFNIELETSNGIKASESGDENGNAKGLFGWTSPEGDAVDISYVADENGYQPQGSVLPTPPPIPEAIARALEWIRAHPPAPEH